MNPKIMPYDRAVKDMHVGAPLFAFPGDEVISGNAYTAAMSNTYLRKLPFAVMLMERFGLQSSQEDQERIRRGLVCMGWLDHMLDEAPDRKVSLQAYAYLVSTLTQPKGLVDLPSWIRPEVGDSVALLRNAIGELPQENITSVSRKAHRIGEISLEKSRAKSVTEYYAVLSEEGALSSDVVIECLHPGVQKTDAYKRLHTFNARAMVAATLLDAAIDLKHDYKNGLSGVTPSFRNRFFLYRKAFAHLPYIVKNLGIKGVLMMLKVGIN